MSPTKSGVDDTGQILLNKRLSQGMSSADMRKFVSKALMTKFLAYPNGRVLDMPRSMSMPRLWG
jgi:hypothetical protein